jgi:hypothetical protein
VRVHTLYVANRFAVRIVERLVAGLEVRPPVVGHTGATGTHTGWLVGARCDGSLPPARRSIL